MKKLSVLLMFMLVFQISAFPIYASEQGTALDNLSSGSAPSVTARSAILMDANSGKVLYSKKANTKRYPASITKIMTTLVAIENCKSLYETVTYSENAINSIEPGSSQIYIEPGEKLTLEESLYAIMLESANEACNGVAEHIGGSIEGFVDLMNKKAKEIGCKNTHFMNPNGLHNDDHYVTAYDMALITKTALQNETFRKIASTVSYTIPATNKSKVQRSLWNHHKMVKKTMYAYDGVEGGKTGFTMMARNTLVTWCKRDNLELIAVTLQDDGYETYSDTIKLFNYGYQNFKAVAPITSCSLDTFHDQESDPVLACAKELSPCTLTISCDPTYTVLTDKKTKASDITSEAYYDAKKKSNYFKVKYKSKTVGSFPFQLSIN